MDMIINTLPYIALIILILILWWAGKKVIQHEAPTVRKGERFDSDSNDIPADLDEAIERLKNKISKSVQDDIASGKINVKRMHHGLGRWMRNNWGLWVGGELRDYFHSIGIRHADDMSGIILQSLERDLRGEDRKLEQQVEYYRNFWKDQGIDPDEIGKEKDY